MKGIIVAMQHFTLVISGLSGFYERKICSLCVYCIFSVHSVDDIMDALQILVTS